MRGCSSTIAEVHSDAEAARLCFVISANSERTFPPPVAPPVAPEGLMPTDPAGLVSQLEGARGTKLDPVILCPGSAQPTPGRPPKLPSP